MKFRACFTQMSTMLFSASAFAATPQVLLEPVADNVVHVRVLPAGVAEAPKKLHSALDPQEQTTRATVPPSAMRVRADVTDGIVRFIDSATGSTLLTPTAAAFSPATINGKEFLATDVAWESGKDDALFGLGAFQDGHLDIRGHSLS